MQANILSASLPKLLSTTFDTFHISRKDLNWRNDNLHVVL